MWLPERWAFINEVPKTSVGKFDKKVLRARHAAGDQSDQRDEYRDGDRQGPGDDEGARGR